MRIIKYVGKRRVGYNELLQYFNELMEETGFRKLCGEYCKGNCCGTAFNKEGLKVPRYFSNTCTRNINCYQKLPCVAYTCRTLNRMISTLLGNWRANNLEHAQIKCINSIADEVAKEAIADEVNPYFDQYSLGEVEHITVRLPSDTQLITTKEAATIRAFMDSFFASYDNPDEYSVGDFVDYLYEYSEDEGHIKGYIIEKGVFCIDCVPQKSRKYGYPIFARWGQNHDVCKKCGKELVGRR